MITCWFNEEDIAWSWHSDCHFETDVFFTPKGFSYKCINQQVLILFADFIPFSADERQIGQVLVGLCNYLTSLPCGSFIFVPMSCSSKDLSKNTHKGLHHWLHPFVYAQYRHVTRLILIYSLTLRWYMDFDGIHMTLKMSLNLM